jgi:hypothetical protein
MKLKHFAALGAGFALAFSGCTTTKSGGAAYDAAAGATIVTGKQTTIAPLAGAVRTVFLKAEMSPSDTEFYLVVLYLSANGGLSAEEVRDSSGARFQALTGTNETIPIQFAQVTKEIYYIPLTRRYLEKHRRSGIEIRLKGPNGTVAATQSSSFVQGFLADVNAAKIKPAGEVIVKKLAQAR